MSYARFNKNEIQTINIPSWFATDFMYKVHGTYTQVYISVLMSYQQGTGVDLEDIANNAGILYSDIKKILEYWNEQKVIKYQTFADGTCEIEFALLEPFQSSIPVIVEKPVVKTVHLQTRPQYSFEEIREYLKNDSVQDLFTMAEDKMGNLLSPTDRKIILGLFDWLKMPIDLIEYLLHYCCTLQNIRKVSSIEKIAINWIEKYEIHTLEDAKAKVLADKVDFQILKRAGISASNGITESQKEFLDKWRYTYKLPLEIILQACDRTSTQISNPNINYLDTILTNWYKQNVNTIEAIQESDNNYQQSKEQNKSKTQFIRPTKNSGKIKSSTQPFHSMSTHNWDFNALKELEMQYHDRLRAGGDNV